MKKIEFYTKVHKSFIGLQIIKSEALVYVHTVLTVRTQHWTLFFSETRFFS